MGWMEFLVVAFPLPAQGLFRCCSPEVLSVTTELPYPGECIGYQWGSVSALKQTFKVLSRECRSDVALVHLWTQSLQSWDAISNDCDWHPTTEQDGRKSVIVLRNRSCLHYCALTASVLVIAAILRQVGCYHLYSDLGILYCSTDLVVVTVKKSRLEIQHWFGMKIGGLTSRFVPKGMSIELINWKKKISTYCPTWSYQWYGGDRLLWFYYKVKLLKNKIKQ